MTGFIKKGSNSMLNQVQLNKPQDTTTLAANPMKRDATGLMAAFLVVFAAGVILDSVRLLHGVTRLSHTNVVLCAVFAVGAIIVAARMPDLGRLVRLGLFIAGLANVTLVCSFFLQGSPQVGRLVALDGRGLSILGGVLVVVGAIQWLRTRRPVDS